MLVMVPLCSSHLMHTQYSPRSKLAAIKETKLRLEQARTELEICQRTGDLGRASELRYGTIPDLESKLPKESTSSDMDDDLDDDDTTAQLMVHEKVTARDIASIVSRATGIPIQNLIKGEREKLLHMEEELGRRVVGQESAIHAVAEAVRLSRAGLHAGNRPIASFFFLGPTGVGMLAVLGWMVDMTCFIPCSLTTQAKRNYARDSRNFCSTLRMPLRASTCPSIWRSTASVVSLEHRQVGLYG